MKEPPSASHLMSLTSAMATWSSFSALIAFSMFFWNQESPNYLSVKSPFEPERIYKRRAPYMAEASDGASRASRIPAGHHEGFIEAFANIYDEFCAAVRDRGAHDFPGAREGVRTMRCVEAALASSASGCTWRRV